MGKKITQEIQVNRIIDFFQNRSQPGGFFVVSGPHRVTENSNCVILNGAKRSEESWFYAGWEARFFPIWVRMTILGHPAQS